MSDSSKGLSSLVKLAPWLVLVFALIMFREPVGNLIGKVTSLEVQGAKVSFSQPSGFQGDLSVRAFYTLISAADCPADATCGSRIKSEVEVGALEELKAKEFVRYTLENRTEGSPEMLGQWAQIELTESGRALLQGMGLLE